MGSDLRTHSLTPLALLLTCTAQGATVKRWIDAAAQRAARERQERAEKYADLQENSYTCARMRAGYKISQYDTLMEQKTSLRRKIETYCK